MRKSFAVLLTLGLFQGLPALARADQQDRWERDKKDRKESREFDSGSRERAQSGNHARDDNRENDNDREEKADRPSRSKGHSLESRENSRDDRSKGRFKDDNRGRNDGRSNTQTIRRDETRVDSRSLERPSQRDRDRKVRAYQWRDKDEEKRGRERGWERPVRLTDTARQRGVRELPQRITNQRDFITTSRERSIIQRPDRDWDGRNITARAIDRGDDRLVVSQMSRITVNRNLISRVNFHVNADIRANHYYWYYDNGYRYCHYRDRWGYRWFGWYVGSYYFWTRYYGGRFWWYDTSFGRWCYWHNGYWWWQDPYRVNVIYLYDNTRYIQAVSEDELEVGLPDDADEDDYDQENTKVRVYRSKDETRMVKVIGRDQEAFLYDTDGSESFKPVYLGNRVKEVKFSNRNSDRPLQVMLVFKDDSFELFDSRGKSLGDREF